MASLRARFLEKPGGNAEWFTVVGVVGSVKLRALLDPDERLGAYYHPYQQRPSRTMTFAIRTSAPESVAGSIRSAISEIDPELPLFDAKSMSQRIDESLIVQRSPVLIALAFSAVALFLAGVGIYGVLAYTVSRRDREIGIRMALGARREIIFRMILTDGSVILALGFGLGLAGTAALGRFLRGTLYGISPFDPLVVGMVVAILGAVALIACVFPARKATRVDPVTVLHP